MADPRDRIELTLLPDSGDGGAAGGGVGGESTGAVGRGRPWLSLLFRCANAYARAYRTADGRGYVGRCPRCGKSIRFMIGVGGTSRRSFEVSC